MLGHNLNHSDPRPPRGQPGEVGGSITVSTGARFGSRGALLGGDAAGSLAAIWACPEVGACLGSASFRSIVPGFTGPLHAETTATSWGST